MRSWTAFLVKWVLATLAYLILEFYIPLEAQLNFIHALVLGLLFAIVGSFADLYMIYKFNRIAATLADVVLGAILTYLGDLVFYNMTVTATFAVISGVLLGFVEFFYHFYFLKKPMRKGYGDYPGNGPL